jgi:hypothetical protein
MRQLLCGLLATGLFLIPTARAQQDDTARAILEKAVKAHGGAEKLAKLKVRQEKTKLTYEAGGETFTETTDSLTALPDRDKETLQRGISTFIVVINGDKGWINSGGRTLEYTAKHLKYQKDRLHWKYVLTLAPLLKDKALALSPLGEIKVNDRPALGVRVSAKDRTDVDLYFDKESGLLTKSVVLLDVEFIYGDYKEVAGLKWPMKLRLYVDGKRGGELEITELRLLDKIDGSAFAKP